MGLIAKLLGRKPSYEEFAKEMIETLAAAGASEIRHDVAAHSLKIGGGSTIFLDNAFSDYVAAVSGRRAAVLQHYATAFVGKPDIPNDFRSCKAALLPVIRDPAYYGLSYLALQAKGAGLAKLKLITKDYAPDLVIGIAYDTAANIATIGQTQLDNWKVEQEEAFAQALDNLREKTDPSKFNQLAPGLYQGAWGDSYDSARVLMPELFYRLSLDGDPVVFMPNRDLLVVTGAYNTGALKMILQVIAPNHFELGHSLSPNFYVCQDGKWLPFLPQDPELASQARSLRSRRRAIDYTQQKTYMDELNKKANLDIFVANCQLLKRKDESLFTRCDWANGVFPMLPVAENLVFLIDIQRKELINVPWEKAWPIISPLLEKVPELLPVRYRAVGFPSSEQVAALRELSVKVG